MNFAPIKPTPRRRPASGFRASVEVLDARQLLAAGVTATPLTVYYDQVAGQPIATIDPANPDLPQTSGRPVPLALLVGASGTLSADGYRATVDWGDGSAVDAASFTHSGIYDTNNPAYLFVQGPDHAYQAPGTYTISVAVTGPGDETPTVVRTTAHVVAPYVTLSGQLNPASDSGLSDADGVTNINTPNFAGTTQPGATVVLNVYNINGFVGTNRVIGVGTADAAGHWSITAAPLADGTYSVGVTALGAFGASTGATIRTTPVVLSAPDTYLYGSQNTLKVDTIGPKITSFRLVDARLGTFQVGYTDAAGLVVAPLTNPSNYAVTRLAGSAKRGQPVAVQTLTIPPTSTGGSAFQVVGTLGTGQPLIPRNGTYTFAIRAAGIAGVSGALLDGEYAGHFPGGDGHPGGDFQVKVTIRNGKQVGLAAIRPVKATPHLVKARGVVASRHRA